MFIREWHAKYIPISEFLHWMVIGWRIEDAFVDTNHGEWSVLGVWDHGEPVIPNG